MKELKHRFDYIIFDTPPVLAVTDSQVLANKCDGVVMVVASGKTRKDRLTIEGAIDKGKITTPRSNSEWGRIYKNGVLQSIQIK